MGRDELGAAAPARLTLPTCGNLAAKRLLDRAIEDHYEDMRGAVRRRGLEPALATEVVHDLYLRLSRRPDCLDGKSSWRAFLIRAAVNLGIDRMRRAAFERRLFAALDAGTEALPAPLVAAEQALEMRQRFDALRTAIADLPRQCRAVFVAYHIGGFSKDEITAGLGMRRRMVDRHLRKALILCMARLEAWDAAA